VPGSVEELVELLDLEAIEDNLFRGTQPDTSLQRVFGGQVAAHALVAASRTVPEEYGVHSLHSYFLRPGDVKVPIVYDVDPLRDGRSFVTRRVVARQHGRPIYFQTASYQKHEEGFEHQDAMPDVPPPEECPTLSELFGRQSQMQSDRWEREWAVLDVRWAGDSRPDGELDASVHPAQARLWIRVNGDLPDDRILHGAAFGITFLIGMMPTLIANTINAGSPFSTTYGGVDATPPELNPSVLLSYLVDVQFTLLAISAVWTAWLWRFDQVHAKRVAILVAANLAANLIFFMTHPIFTPYYIIPIDMLSLWTLLFATLGLRGEQAADSTALLQPAKA